MRLKPRAVRLRTLIALVALAGVVAWAIALRFRARAYDARARQHRALMNLERQDHQYAEMMVVDLSWYQPALRSDLELWERNRAEAWARLKHHERWVGIYDRASRRPWEWIPPEPDPP